MTARRVATAPAGEYGDGAGLILRVSESLSRKWVYRYSLNGRRREMGLGTVQDGIGLADARLRAAEARRLVKDRIDPIDARRSKKSASEARKTFGECADAFIEAKRAEWRSDRHVYQWRLSMGRHAAPLRDMPVDSVDTSAVLSVLSPLWQRAPETASRVRGRIELVLDAARVQGMRVGDNPARWRGHLSHILPKRQRIAKQHYSAMPYAELPSFIARLRERESVARLALEFTIACSARSGEVLGATWSEIDIDGRTWTLAPSRMKSGRGHIVPLSGRALEILNRVKVARTGNIVFPGRVHGRPLAPATFGRVLSDMGIDATAHGFRAAFATWCQDRGFPADVIETALAHQIGTETTRAYSRSDLLQRRRDLMDAWARFLEGKAEGGADVLAFKRP